MDKPSLVKRCNRIFRLILSLLLTTNILVGAAAAAPTSNILYAESPLAASLSLLAYASDGQDDVEVMIFVPGFESYEIISGINQTFHLLTGLRYTLLFSLQSDYPAGQVKLQMIHKDAEYLETIFEEVDTVSAAARLHSDIPAEQLRYTVNALRSAAYDYDSINDRENADGLAWSAYGCLVKKQTVCEGYTNALTLICSQLGIPAIEISGTGAKGGSHVWNKVYIDGTWLAIDVTANRVLVPSETLQTAGYVYDTGLEKALEQIPKHFNT